jgi:anti-sigma regulatory factor (Ser/Thr protein kinase)
MKKSAKLTRAFLLKLELRSHPTLLCVIRGALGPLMEMLGFSAEHNREIIRAVDEAVSNIMRHSYRGRLDQPIEVYCNRLQRRTNGETEQGVEIRLRACRGPDEASRPATGRDKAWWFRVAYHSGEYGLGPVQTRRPLESAPIGKIRPIFEG